MSSEDKALLDQLWADAESMWQDSAKGFNNLVLLLGTGAFAISISYMGVLKNSPNCQELLVGAWISLAVALAGQIFWYMSAMSWGERIKILVNLRLGKEMPNGWNPNSDGKMKEINQRLDWLVKVTAFFLVAGVAFLLFFAIANLP